VRRLFEYLSESSRAFRDVFANPGLRRLQLAWAGSILGSWAYGIAVVVYAFEQGGATAVGVVGLIRWFAAAIASPFAALLGDRYDRRAVMVVSDLTRAVLIFGAALIVLSDGPPIVVYAIACLVGIAATAFRPAEAALVPTLARTPEELTAANVSASAIESVGMFAGPALGGLLLAASGTQTVFFVTAGLLLWSAILVAGIRHRQAAEPSNVQASLEDQAGSIIDEFLAGFRTIAEERRLRLLVGLFSAQSFVDGMLNVLIVVIALDLLDTGNAGVGFLNSATGIGGLLGALAAALLMGRKRLASDFGLGIFIWGVPLALVAIWPNQAFVLVLLAMVGIGNTIVDVSGMTLLQRSAPDEVLARVFGVLESLFLLATGLGALAAPILLGWLGTRGALIAAGALLPLLVIPAWPRLTEIDRTATIPEAQLELLRANAIFAPLPEPTIEQLAKALEERRAEPGEVVVRQGESGELFYLIKKGELDVAQNGKTVHSLGPGDSFGEIALLRDVPRTASVIANSPTILYTLERGEFLAAVTGYAPSLSAAEGVIGARLGPARAGGMARA
jgi:MFS family permease